MPSVAAGKKEAKVRGKGSRHAPHASSSGEAAPVVRSGAENTVVDEDHPTGPIVHTGSRVLLCGTFPPVKKSINFYYPNSNNDMWRVLGQVFFADKDHFYQIAEVHKQVRRSRQVSVRVARSLNEEAIRDFAAAQPVGFFDVCRSIRRHRGTSSDDNIEALARTDVFRDVLTLTPHCEAIITTGTLALTMLLDVLHGCGSFSSATGEAVEAVTRTRLNNVKYNLPRVGGKLLWKPSVTSPFHTPLCIYRAPSTSRALPLSLEVKTAHYRAMLAAHAKIAEERP